MRKLIGISALAFSAALAAGPATAQLLDLGGDEPLIDLGTSSDPGVNVNLGTDTGVSVDLGGTPDVSVDLDSDTGGDITVDLPSGDDGDSGIGGLVDLDGGDNVIGVDLDNDSDDNEVVVGLPTGDDAIVDLFGTGTNGLVDLGDDDVDAVVDLDLGDDDVIVDLFGTGEGAGTVVDLELLNGGEGAGLPVLDETIDIGDVGLDLAGLLGGEVIPDLFGDGGTVELLDLGDLDVNLPDIAGLGDGVGGLPSIGLPEIGLPSVALPELLGPGDDGDDGDDGVDGVDGDDGVAVVGDPDSPVVPGIVVVPGDTDNDFGDDVRDNGVTPTTRITTNRATAQTKVAAQTRVAAPANTKCFTPDSAQIDHLVSSRTYSDRVVATWRNASTVAIVPVRLCPDARVRVSEVAYGNANMSIMRSGIAQSPAIRQKLQGTGIDSDDVLAVDTKDGQLVVYVY